jgi:trehalose 6-phosphate phosphatase
MQTDTALRPPFDGSIFPGPRDLRSIALLLDVDGTIVDMAITPGSVTVSDSLRASLHELHKRCDGALALVSGRLIGDIDHLFAPLRLPAIGGHGAEMRPAADASIQARTADAIGDGLRKLVMAAAAVDPRVIVEDKTSSLAVHYRLAPHMEQPLKTKIAAILARLGVPDLEILYGKALRLNRLVLAREWRFAS